MDYVAEEDRAFFLEFARLAQSCFGISSQLAVIRTNVIRSPCHTTSSSSRFFAEISSHLLTKPNHLQRIFIEMLSSQSKVYGDGGWFASLLCTKLILSGWASNLSKPILIAGYNAALSNCLGYVENCKSFLKIPFEWSDASTLTCLVKCLLQTKALLSLTPHQLSHITDVIISAFVESLHSPANYSGLFPNVMYCQAPGLSPDSVTYFVDTLIMDIPIPQMLCRCQLSSLKVALFDCSLEAPSTPADVTIQIDRNNDTSATTSIKAVEYQLLESFVAMLMRSGVGLVCCQRRIHPFVLRLCASRNILCIPRLSIRFMRHLQQLSGATNMGAFPPDFTTSQSSIIPLEHLGYLQSVGVERIGRRRYVVAKGTAGGDVVQGAETQQLVRRPIVTLLLAMHTNEQCAELQAACESIVTVLTHCLQSPNVLPGAGCWQACVAQHLDDELASIQQQHLDRQEKLICSAARLFSSALRACSQAAEGDVCRIEGNPMNPSKEGQLRFSATRPDVASSVQESIEPHRCGFRSPFGNVQVAIVRERHKVVDEDLAQNCLSNDLELEYAEVLDPYVPCISALKLAVEVACSVLEVDGCIVVRMKETANLHEVK